MPTNEQAEVSTMDPIVRFENVTKAFGELVVLRELDFDPHVRTPSPRQQPLEPDLRAAWTDLLWAQHLVLVFPTWWGAMPALLKGFLDRVLLPGAAFVERPANQGFEGLLRGRTAELITNGSGCRARICSASRRFDATQARGNG